MKKKGTWIGIIISILFLYLAFRKSNFSQIIEEAGKADLLYFAAATPIMFLSFYLRTLRWRYLLKPIGEPGLHSLFSSVMIGYMSLNILPLRLGEFIRAFVLGKHEKMAVSGIFATVVVERIFDGFVLLLLLILALLFMPMELSPKATAWIRAFSYLAVMIYFAAMACLALIKWKTGLFLKIVNIFFGRFPGLNELIVRMVNSFIEGLASISDKTLFIKTLVMSVFIWLAYAGYYWVTAFAVRGPDGALFGLHVGLWGSIFILSAIAFGVMLPSSPGFVGVFELAAITALTALGAERPVAESYAILVHASQFLPITIVGLFYLYFYNFNLKQIKEGGSTVKSEINHP